MDKEQFNQLFNILVKETGVKNNNSATNMDDAYETYLDLVNQVEQTDTAEKHMNQMISMDKNERLRWRMCLAEEGIEMTPSQVDEYIVILELALSTT